MAANPKYIYVYAHWQGLKDVVLMGTLTDDDDGYRLWPSGLGCWSSPFVIPEGKLQTLRTPNENIQ